MDIETKRVEELKPYAGNARTHSTRQVRQIADSIERFGFINSVLISDDGNTIAGYGRVRAAKLLRMETLPTIRLSHLSSVERRAYVMADKKLALNTGWDPELLALELQGLINLDFDVEVTDFELAEIDLALAFGDDASNRENGKADQVPQPSTGPSVTQSGDLWLMGDHRLLCGDAQKAEDIERLVAGRPIDLVFTDPPYDVPIDDHICGSGRIDHREFEFVSGEMSQTQFTSFLSTTLSNASAVCCDGAIAFVCMDWRHMRELMDAGEAAFSELKNLCVWNKTNGGMGTFYRCKHELIFVFKIGTAPHINSFGLGENGRYRTNIWD